MGSKRKSSDKNGDGEASPTRAGGSKRCCCDRRGQGYTLDEFVKKLDPRELQQVKKLCQKYGINAPDLSSRECKYRFQFREDKLYTDTNFKAEIVLVDASNNVISFGPMATGKIEIVVLNGDIDVDENGEWTEEEFKNYVLEPRKDKGPLLIGNLPTRLCNGIGSISDAKFTDNSCWTKSKTFRLGVRGMANEVQEGISKAFRVLDRHMKQHQKDRPPSMNDKVYRLKGIFKNGPYHKKLVECNINTVWDFLFYCSKNRPETLRDMIGMKKGNWERTYGHASKSRERPDVLLDRCLANPPAPARNFYELTGSSSFQTSNILVQPNGMFTPAQGLAPPIGLELGNSWETIFIINEGFRSETYPLVMPFEGLPEENGRNYVLNNSDIGSPLLRDKWLMLLLFIARLRMAARRTRESNCSLTSSPRRNWFKLMFILVFIARLTVTALRSRKSKHSETISPRQNDDESVYEGLSPFGFNEFKDEEFYEVWFHPNL